MISRFFDNQLSTASLAVFIAWFKRNGKVGTQTSLFHEAKRQVSHCKCI